MGKIISLSGVDNAGKSTQSKLLVEHYANKSKTVYTTEFAFSYFLLRPIIKRLRKKTGSPTSGPVVKNRKFLPKLWFIPAFIDIWLGYLLHLKPLSRKYDYILADRFYCDIWLNLLYYGYITEWAYENLIKLLPKSDLAIVLMISPSVGHSRINDEFPISYYNKQISMYKRMAKKIGGENIYSNKSPESVNKNIISIIDEKL